MDTPCRHLEHQFTFLFIKLRCFIGEYDDENISKYIQLQQTKGEFN